MGDYLGTKWKMPRRGCSKLHAVISIHEVSVISFAITDEHVHDAKAGKELLTSVKERIRKIFGYKDYDSRTIYNTFGKITIIPPRKNASTRSSGSPSRAKIVRQIRKTSE